MADTCIECDVAIVGSGFAGSLIAKELSRHGIRVVILEAGSGVQPNINGYMRSFYKASAKVPESPYPPRARQCSIRGRRWQADGTNAVLVQLERA
jgi:glucose dehydrogenase